MEFYDVISKRYSVRAYQSTPVPDDQLNYVLEAARLAPTAVNYQPFQLLVVHTQGREQELKQIYARDWFVQAPLIICGVSIPEKGWVRQDNRSYVDVDVTIAFDHMILAATEIGLGTCWIANFNAQAARDVLQLPDDVEPLLFTPLGYPASQPGSKKRRSLSELVRYERW